MDNCELARLGTKKQNEPNPGNRKNIAIRRRNRLCHQHRVCGLHLAHSPHGPCGRRLDPETPGRHPNCRLAAGTADDKSSNLQVDWIHGVLLGRPIDNQIDVRAQRRRPAAAETDTARADVASEPGPPPRLSPVLRDPKVNRNMNSITIVMATLLCHLRHLGPPLPLRQNITAHEQTEAALRWFSCWGNSATN